MNIVFLCEYIYANGGAAKVAIEEANLMANRGHQVYFLACEAIDPKRPAELDPLVHVISTQQGDLWSMPTSRALTIGWSNTPVHDQLSALLLALDQRSTIVHLHSWTRGLSSRVIRTTLKAGFKITYTLHDYVAACPTGSFFHHGKQQPCGLTAMSISCITSNCDSRHYAHKLWRVGRQYKAQLDGLPGGITDFIIPAAFTRDILQAYLPPRANLHVLPNSIACRKAPRILVENNTQAIFIGRMSAEKGLEHALQACALSDWTITAIGDGPLRANLQKAYPNVNFTGWLPWHETQEHIRTARFAMFPSLWYENDPLVVKELSAHGIPIVSGDVSAIGHQLKHLKTGLVYPSGDSHACADMLKLVHQDALVKQISDQCYNSFWNNDFSPQRHADSLESIYQRILDT